MKEYTLRCVACLAFLALALPLAACTQKQAFEQETTKAETESVSEAETLTETLTETETKTETEEETTVNVTYKPVQNPVYTAGADPWITEHNGEYYYCFSAWDNVVWVNKLSSIAQITWDGCAFVYVAPQEGMYSHEYWAPELHYINGEWYIYVAADDGNNENHRMYVLKGTSQDPMQPFEMVGQITDPSNKWAIDGTVMQYGDELYFIWSGWEGDVNVAQNIYIAHMSDPCTIDSERVCISVPEYAWEKVGEPHVNEGPAVLQHDGKTFLTYSASGSWTDDYCLGMLTLVGDDPMNPEHWEKSSKPVFKKRPGTCYGPGHNSFCAAPDGSIWMIYHANLESGTGWDGRSIWITPVTFEEDGTPKFGSPRSEVEFPEIVQ